jgi:raffinose/stachyose/melibiose transport system substrate-binding protein
MVTTVQAGMSRRRALALLGALGAGAAASACAGPGSTSNDAPPKAADTGKVTGAISFAHWRGEDRQVLDQIIADFVTANPGTSVSQDISLSGDYQRVALQRIRDGAVGDAFTAFRGAQFIDMNKAGVFTDLSGQPMIQRYEPALIEAGMSSGKQVGLPYLLVYNMPLVNVDLLERAGATEPPGDWDGYLALCERLKGLGVTPIIFPGGSLADANQLVNSMVMNNAPSDDMFTKIESGEYKCTDDWFLKTLDQYRQLRPYIQPNASGTGAEAAQQMFARGQGAMFVTGSYYIKLVRNLGAKFPIDVLSPITVSAAERKYEGVHNTTFILGVNAASDNQATATAFLDRLSDPAVAGVYANGTAQHVTVAGVTYTDPDLKALEPWTKKKTLISALFQFTNLDVRGAVQDACFKVITGSDPAKAAQDAQRIVDQNR